ncbi:hypothetical protein [Deinococcus roseus]|uniref:Uncharacterized protein n=1 Tax=Deinococcus roseus TaxID=392414 RepID=A0ABQ2CXE3_9DEIO|nr:hypothetical protein [Deinococcus roseus]GGJ30012.1 hypothetical protein GCM10008938_15000 [Deinococcus roseus]
MEYLVLLFVLLPLGNLLLERFEKPIPDHEQPLRVWLQSASDRTEKH